MAQHDVGEVPADQTIGPGLRAAIVHYGEGAEPDPGHRSHRAGRLAAALVAAGCEVTRIVPSYRVWDGVQRPTDWTGLVGDEGRLVVVPTRAYRNTRGRDRAGSLMDFNRGVARALGSAPTPDLVMMGFPPPGLLRAVRSVAPEAAVIADIRDLWPDALVPGGTVGRILAAPARLAGGLLARELRRADAVVALSATMLDRAPAGAPVTRIIPIGFEPLDLADRAQWPEGETPLTACFVGSMTQLFDFDAMLRGWSRFVADRGGDGPMPRLVVVGDGEQRAIVDRLAAGEPTVACTGWILGDQVAAHLHRADVGLAPTRTGQGTTLSNKVSEYLAAGMWVINTLTPSVGGPLSTQGLGDCIDSTPEAWAAAFARAEQALPRLRAGRAARLAEADRHYGSGQTNVAWFDLIAEVLAARADRRPRS
ncbi:MAG: glycosyltransferase [Actinomycetota bacterium]